MDATSPVASTDGGTAQNRRTGMRWPANDDSPITG